MPPKAKKKNAKAPAPPLADPLAAECLAAIKEERSATAKLAEMDEDEPGVEEQTAKAADAQYALIETMQTFVSRQNLYRPKHTPESYELQMAYLSILEILQQYRKAETDLARSQCIKRLQAAGNHLAEVGTNDFGFQLGRPWAPSVKDDEEDAFGPYPTEPKINKYLLDDGTILFVDVRTGRAVADEAGNSIEVQFKKEEDSDQEMMEDGEEHSGGETDSEAHGHDDSDDDPDDDAHGDDDGDDK